MPDLPKPRADLKLAAEKLGGFLGHAATSAAQTLRQELIDAGEELIRVAPGLAAEVADLAADAALFVAKGRLGELRADDADAAAKRIMAAAEFVVAKAKELGAQALAERYARALGWAVEIGRQVIHVTISIAAEAAAAALRG